MEGKFQDMNLKQVQAEACKYYKKHKTQTRKNQLYVKIIQDLTEQSVSDFITEDENKEPVINEDEIARFRRGGEMGGQIRKVTATAEAAQSKIEELNCTIQYLERELNNTITSSAAQVKLLNDELTKIKKDDSIERLKNLISTLSNKRKSLPLKDLHFTVESRSHLMTQLFGNEYVANEKNDWEDFCQGQKEIELSIIESCSELLRNTFDALPGGINKLNKETIAVDVAPILEMISDSRNRLSYVMTEQAFLRFLQEHVSEIQEILELFNSRARQDSGFIQTSSLKISLSPYEKGLLYFKGSTLLDSYLMSYMRPSEAQKRLLLHGRNSAQLTAFDGFEEFPSFLLFCQPEDAVKTIMIRTKPVNNVSYIQIKSYNGPDPYSFYTLSSLKDGKCTWKIDPHALFIIRSFKHQYLNLGEKVFKQFYKDALGHNEFKSKFEEQMESKGIERWKQMSILYENMQIVGDEYLIGEIIRKCLMNNALHYPKEETDIIQGEKDIPDTHADFKRVRERWTRGLPPSDEEPEEYLNHCFDKYKDWRVEMTLDKYKRRWFTFLQVQKPMNNK
jgi:hypothetical protein